MNGQINQLVKSLLKKETLDQCSLQELEQFAERHPYFGAAQLLLTKKLQEEKSERYGEQLQKTFSFFNNPLWVQHLLNETGNAELIFPENKVPETEIIVDVPSKEVKEELLFEPFHTVDYFASQGIQYKEEPKADDKFGKQLKSFTDWLKTMKRLAPTEIGKTITTVSEKNVEQLAQHSLAEKEVITEAMAAVWEKQGNITKAVDIYEKLSLLEPAKSHSFAAKIEDLKKKN